MMAKVNLLDEASHTVRLISGWDDDGSRKGNSAKPAVAIAPAGTSAEHSIAGSGQRRSSNAAAAPANATTTAGIASPLIQPPCTTLTLLRVGLDGPSCARIPAMRYPLRWASQAPAATNSTAKTIAA